jgi:hypothetical protein
MGVDFALRRVARLPTGAGHFSVTRFAEVDFWSAFPRNHYPAVAPRSGPEALQS